jgi:hypothetical protein
MTNVTGFLLRTSLSDTGTLPRTGSWTGCPDIIPAGLDAISRDDLIRSYGSVTDKPLTQGLTNYLYLRAKNMNTTPLTQVAYMFQVPGSLVLRPDVWYKATNLVGFDVRTDGDGTPDDPKIIKKYAQTLTANPGQIAVTEGYTWAPQTTEHHCLVGVVANSWDDVRSHFPNGINSTDDLGRWIYANGSIGWHNVNIQPLSPSIYEAAVPYSHSGIDEPITFTMIAENVPVGALISFSSNASTTGGRIIGQTWTAVAAPPSGGSINPDFEVGTTLTVNAGYKTIITYRTDFRGLTPPANFRMHMKAAVGIKPPASANAFVASFRAADSFTRSYYRSFSVNSIFRDADGKMFGHGIGGYRAMATAMRLQSGDDDGDLEETKVVIVGSHTTTPVSS